MRASSRVCVVRLGPCRDYISTKRSSSNHGCRDRNEKFVEAIQNDRSARTRATILGMGVACAALAPFAVAPDVWMLSFRSNGKGRRSVRAGRDARRELENGFSRRDRRARSLSQGGDTGSNPAGLPADFLRLVTHDRRRSILWRTSFHRYMVVTTSPYMYGCELVLVIVR